MIRSGRFRYWFDDGRGGCWIYGEVYSYAEKFLTVQFDDGRRQRLRVGSAAHANLETVNPVTPPDKADE